MPQSLPRIFRASTKSLIAHGRSRTTSLIRLQNCTRKLDLRDVVDQMVLWASLGSLALPVKTEPLALAAQLAPQAFAASKVHVEKQVLRE